MAEKLKNKRKCDPKTCPMFFGLFLEGQEMSGQAKEAVNRKLLKWIKMDTITQKLK